MSAPHDYAWALECFREARAKYLAGRPCTSTPPQRLAELDEAGCGYDRCTIPPGARVLSIEGDAYLDAEGKFEAWVRAPCDGWRLPESQDAEERLGAEQARAAIA
jgi:hypothetical protein